MQPYDAGTNGGIVGTVTYDTTRNELDPADAVTEAYQPGIPDVPVHLYASEPCTATTAEDKANSCRQGKEIVPLQVDRTRAEPGAMIDEPRPGRGALVKGPRCRTPTRPRSGAAARLHRPRVQRRRR